MKIIVWGLGYVGTVSAACLAKLGHDVIGIDTNSTKVTAINEGRTPVKEPGLDDLVSEMVRSGKLKAERDGVRLVETADLSLICVGTPSAVDGNPMLDFVRKVAIDIGTGLRNTTSFHVVVLRSTVFPGTTRNILSPLLEEISGKTLGKDFGVVMNPEFLRETTAIADFNSPNYTVIGELDKHSGDLAESLYASINAKICRVTMEEAELLKLVNNSFHALKIGFANEIGRLCSQLNIDSNALMKIFVSDTKLNISQAYLKPGFAFGGSCLPKDVRSLVFNARKLGIQLPILEAILPSNQMQIDAVHQEIKELGLRRIAILGLSFKPGTDDLRESPVITLIRQLWQDDLDIIVYDPDVRLDEMLGSNREYLKRQLPQIDKIMRHKIDEALNDCQVVVVTQKRQEFISALKGINRQLTVFDFVNLKDEISFSGLTYKGISW